MTLNEKVKLIVKIIELLKVILFSKALSPKSRSSIIDNLIDYAQKQIDIDIFIANLVDLEEE